MPQPWEKPQQAQANPWDRPSTEETPPGVPAAHAPKMETVFNPLPVIAPTLRALAGPAGMAAEELYGGAKRIGGEIGQAGRELMSGNPAAAGVHAISAVPVIGPAMIQGSQDAPTPTPGESYLHQVGAAATSPRVLSDIVPAAAEVAPMLLGGLDTAAPNRSLLGQVPSKARAGAILEEIRNQAANVPVRPTEVSPNLARFQELTQRGGSTAKPATQLSSRLRSLMVPTQNTAPLNFPEARDFYSNISAQSSEDMSRLNPIMRRQMGAVRQGLHQDLTSAADTIGRGDDYANAVREYARRSKLDEAAKTAAKYALPALGAGALGDLIYQKFIK